MYSPTQTTNAVQNSTEDVSQIIDNIVNGLPQHVTEENKQKMNLLLHKYKSVISTGGFDIGFTDMLKHQIDTGNHAPISEPMRRHLLPFLMTIDNEIDKMLQHKIISPSTSEWSSTVCLVRKSDNSTRFAIDYRLLNRCPNTTAIQFQRLAAVWIR